MFTNDIFNIYVQTRFGIKYPIMVDMPKTKLNLAPSSRYTGPVGNLVMVYIVFNEKEVQQISIFIF